MCTASHKIHIPMDTNPADISILDFQLQNYKK